MLAWWPGHLQLHQVPPCNPSMWVPMHGMKGLVNLMPKWHPYIRHCMMAIRTNSNRGIPFQSLLCGWTNDHHHDSFLPPNSRIHDAALAQSNHEHGTKSSHFPVSRQRKTDQWSKIRTSIQCQDYKALESVNESWKQCTLISQKKGWDQSKIPNTMRQKELSSVPCNPLQISKQALHKYSMKITETQDSFSLLSHHYPCKWERNIHTMQAILKIIEGIRWYKKVSEKAAKS